VCIDSSIGGIDDRLLLVVVLVHGDIEGVDGCLGTVLVYFDASLN